MIKQLPVLSLLLAVLLLSCSRGTPLKNPKAGKVAHNLLIADGYIQFRSPRYGDQQKNPKNNNEAMFAYNKARSGGLNAAFLALGSTNAAKGGVSNVNLSRVDSLINDVRDFTTHHSGHFAMATSPGEVQKNKSNNKISLCLGLESGADIDQVRQLYAKGIRYMNLKAILSSSAGGTRRDSTQMMPTKASVINKWIHRMNQVGMIIDVSGLSESTFSQILNKTRAPVIAAHSSVRYFTPGFTKNLSDSMMVHLAKNGGVMMISFDSNFISDSSRVTSDSLQADFKAYLKSQNVDSTSTEARDHLKELREESYYHANVTDVADHIDYAANLMGIDHVGLGSGFNGLENRMPHRLQAVSDYPNLIKVLLNRGYTTKDIRKICYGNLARVWNRVLAIAQIDSASAQPIKRSSRR